MKTKARDLIAGWPRPRSTSVLRLNLADYKWHFFLLGRRYQEHEDPGWLQDAADLHLEMRYRQHQQAMQDWHFEEWRHPPDRVLLQLRRSPIVGMDQKPDRSIVVWPMFLAFLSAEDEPRSARDPSRAE